ncbi:MAG: SpoIIE family protein phosphatase [Spirochaetaceae bacterium]|nr:SpoIIE family protein phosphatase [Spirochaetaceae bacterium]
MRIRTKFTLLQLIILAGFLMSMAFVMLRFSQAYALKRLELRGVESRTELKTLEQKTTLFSSRAMRMSLLWDDWTTSYQRFDYYYTSLLESPYHRLLGERAILSRDARAEAWETIKELEIEPLIRDIESSLAQDLPELTGNRGINISREIIGTRIGYDSPQAVKLAALESRFRNLRESLIASITLPTDRFLEDLRLAVARFSGTLYITTFAITLLIQAGGAFIGFRFSRGFSFRIIQLERTLAKVAEGNFKIHLDIRTGDEFEDIAHHFNILTQDLWIRLDSMKDMMRDIGSSAGEDIKMGELEDFMLELAIDNTGADAGFLMNVEDGMLTLSRIQGYAPPPMALPHMVAGKREYVMQWFAGHRIAPGEGILGQVLATGEARFVRHNDEGELADNADKESDRYINSAIFIPLVVSDTTVGLLALELTRQDSLFTDLDFSYMRSYGEFIAMTLDNMTKYIELLHSHQINREIQVAADIQKTLLPEKMPNLSGVEVAAFSDAAKGVSGDYYDVFDLGAGKTAVVICDVAGKGVPASLLMIMIRTVIRSISSPGKRADHIMTELNRAITGRLGADRFATISLIILDSEKGTVSYSNGAHHPLYILRGDTRTYRMFDTDGLPMGIDINASFGHKMIRVHSQDYLVLFTDGLPEARNGEGEELGTERLLRFIARHADQPPVEVARRVKDYVDDFTSGLQHDDQTFVALKVG